MNTITREFTKEQLQQIEAAAKEVLWPVVWSGKKAREHFCEKITPKVVLKLARIALASLEAGPVYQVYGNNDDTWSDVDEEEMIRLRRDGEDTRTLYTAQPAPVSVLDEKDKSVDADDHPLLWSYSNGWNACRAAMLQGGDGNYLVIQDGSDDTKRLDWLDAQNKRLNEYYGTSYGWKFDANFQRNAMMLNDSNYPVMTVRQAIDEAIATAPKQEVK